MPNNLDITLEVATLPEQTLEDVQAYAPIRVSSPYLEWVGLVSQNSGSNPTVEVKKNTLGLPTLTFTRASTGVYESAMFEKTGLTLLNLECFLRGNSYLRSGQILDYQAAMDNIFTTNFVLSFRLASIDSNGTRSPIDFNLISGILTIRHWT